jgi:hypothetical protein
MDSEELFAQLLAEKGLIHFTVVVSSLSEDWDTEREAEEGYVMNETGKLFFYQYEYFPKEGTGKLKAWRTPTEEERQEVKAMMG